MSSPLVLHVVGSFDLSGRSRMILDLSRGMVRLGYGFACAVLGREIGFRQAGMECVALGKKGDGLGPAAALRLLLLARGRRAALLHSHGRGAVFYAAFAARLLRAPLVHTVHRADGDLISGRAWARRAALRGVGAVAAVSDAAARAFAEGNGFPRERVATVRNGIDLGAFPPRPQPPARAAAVLVAVANLSKDKDIETLLRGFAAVAGRRPARLRLAGDGPRRGDAERLVAELGLGDSVELLGFREDVAAVLADADLFVHCARTEGLGIAVLEATASGVPVVASATGGITEIVENGVTGRLFPPGDAPAFCAAVLDALDDGAGSAAMARRARRKVEREFSLEGMCGAYAQIYRGVVDGRERN